LLAKLSGFTHDRDLRERRRRIRAFARDADQAYLFQDFRLQPQVLKGLTAVGERVAIDGNKTLIGDFKTTDTVFASSAF
ncbi:hypothetical protein, partial [Pseudomonas viridiflava]|uniref:hypothetical protein n=1 Tax=Pseudomonas viridiflava TaxID=33069 RepID=UPI0013CE7D1E